MNAPPPPHPPTAPPPPHTPMHTHTPQVFRHLDLEHDGRVDYVSWTRRIAPEDTRAIAARCRERGPFAEVGGWARGGAGRKGVPAHSPLAPTPHTHCLPFPASPPGRAESPPPPPPHTVSPSLPPHQAALSEEEELLLGNMLRRVGLLAEASQQARAVKSVGGGSEGGGGGCWQRQPSRCVYVGAWVGG